MSDPIFVTLTTKPAVYVKQEWSVQEQQNDGNWKVVARTNVEVSVRAHFKTRSGRYLDKTFRIAKLIDGQWTVAGVAGTQEPHHDFE